MATSVGEDVLAGMVVEALSIGGDDDGGDSAGGDGWER